MKHLYIYRIGRLILLIHLFSGSILHANALDSKVERVILFTIDGMHWKAPDLVYMPVMESLIEEGTYIQKSYMIIPHHPTIGDYSKFNSCSFPNPMLHEGTVFIKPENKFIQEMLFSGSQSAFVVNTMAYKSVARGFTTCIMDPSISDKQVVERSVEILESQHIRFMRIHLQSPGDIGQAVVSVSTPQKSYYRNIFGKNSPYITAIEKADFLLGELINYLKKSGKWDDTVLIVTSDHGQSIIGWHPLFDEDSWVTPLVFIGPRIAKNRRLSYFEHIDIAPTIAFLLEIDSPSFDGGKGKIVPEILESSDVLAYNPEMYIKTINEQIKEFNLLKSRLLLAAEKERYYSNIIASLENQNITPEPFYHQDRITDWYKAGSIKHMIDANELILRKMRESIARSDFIFEN